MNAAPSSLFLDPANLELKRAELIRRYQELPDQDQVILQMISIIYEPTSRTALLSCLNGVKAKPQKIRLTSAKIRPSIATLLERELLIEESQKLRCHPLVIELVTRETVANKTFEAMSAAVESCLPLKPDWYSQSTIAKREQQFLRAFRIRFYHQDFPGINVLCQTYYRYNYAREGQLNMDLVLELVCNNPFDQEWFRTIPPELSDVFLVNALLADSLILAPAEDKLESLYEICEDVSGEFINIALAEQLMLRGRFEEVRDCLPDLMPEYEYEALAIEGWLSFIEGDYRSAISQYQKALRILKKAIGAKTVYFPSISGVFYVLALMKEGSSSALTEAIRYTKVVVDDDDHWLLTIYELLLKVLNIQTGDLSDRDRVIKTQVMPYQSGNSLYTLLGALCVHWVDASPAKQSLIEVLGPFCQQAHQTGYAWFASEAAAVISQLTPPKSKTPKCIGDITLPYTPLAELLSAKEEWQLSLQALEQLNPDSTQTEFIGESYRLAWFVTWSSKQVLVEPKEQKRNAKGVWSKGRKISLSRLFNQRKTFDYLLPQDQQACTQLEAYDIYRYGYHKTEYRFTRQAIAHLIGHPAVYWADAPQTRIDIIKGEPELLVKDTLQGQLILELSPQLPRGRDVMVIKETMTRLKIIQINAGHRRISEILGPRNCLSVPTSAKTQVLSAINAISGIVTVQSDIDGGAVNAEIVPTQSIPHVQLLPVGEGLKVTLRTRPFAPMGSYFQPGLGGKTVIVEIEGKRLQTTRNLEEEHQFAQDVITACPTLSRYANLEGEWTVDDTEECLELLSDLKTLDEQVVVVWPEGEKLRIRHQADLSHLQLRISQQQDWFELNGELALDDGKVLDMQHLLELLGNQPSRFVPLADGQFLALTQRFRKRLEDLRSFSDSHGQSRRFHPLASLALEDFVDEVGDLQVDQHWKAHVKRLKTSESLAPKVPTTLQAELRDYQIEGFEWLSRLAHWGVGACLADDMGLGKTIQALAVILNRAPKGPTLVIAPTSVGMNWVSEAEKFAPTLTPIQLGYLSGSSVQQKRAELLETLQPFDLLVCSYGLLQQAEVAEKLAQVEWETIVLDEAQAIKNFATKRSKAAMALQGKFKVITTGTPIENHLGELWNLFRFINPGLLGSLKEFNHKYAYRIERTQDLAARNRLKKLIQPFILRRTKTQVLEELPSRTEIVLQVELSQAEMAFYEALRREALKKLEDSDAEAGQKHLQVLAELMKLRRACCNSRLVLPQSDTPSAKLQLFAEVLDELLENNHKALVFSQFVDHLHLIRDFLDERQYAYQYLDGSTPAKKRKERVDAFQAGEGDVFLISLKAGGTGLNLTAADYVIHMDPWWNPAVEDQASDRAHRIGQQRPVTIYRLVAQNTIEEKIVTLHRHKRDLADRLLEGTDVSGKISTSELLQLMQGERLV